MFKHMYKPIKELYKCNGYPISSKYKNYIQI